MSETITEGQLLLRGTANMPSDARVEAIASAMGKTADNGENILLDIAEEAPNLCVLPDKGYVPGIKGSNGNSRPVLFKADSSRRFYEKPERAHDEAESDIQSACSDCLLTLLAQKTGLILCSAKSTSLSTASNSSKRYAPAIERKILP